MQFAHRILNSLWLYSIKSTDVQTYIKIETVEFSRFLSTRGCSLKSKASLLNSGISLHLFDLPTSRVIPQLNILLLPKDNYFPSPPKSFYPIKHLQVL